ncbi:MAG TPA: choice-of-anchor D domain-containing protein, partial [Candidatus Latescibacteria bacterium]|nr:choice-of-anchor D domain-containing protein [Candidatus Latescibacterota bacterium]
VSPEASNFGELPVGEHRDTVLWIYNRGKAELKIVSTSLVYGTNFELLDELSGKVVAPGKSLSLTVRFIPKEAGELSDTLIVVTNDPSRPEVRVVLSGVGLRPEIRLSQEALNFGQVQLGTYRDTTLSIRNLGNEDLEITQTFLISGKAFELLKDLTGTSVPSGEEVSLGIRFSPTGLEEAADTLVVVSNDPEGPEVRVPLSGEGVDTVPPTVDYSPPPQDFRITPGQSFEVRISARDPSGIDSALFCWRLGGERSFSLDNMDKVGEDTFMTTFSTSDVNRGLEFYLRVVDGAGNSWQSLSYTVRGKLTDEGVERPSPTLAKRYQMISLPIIPNDPSPRAILEPILGPYDKTRWRLFWWDPDEGRYVEYPKVEVLMPGLSYWLITKEPQKLYTGPGESVPLDTISVRLKPGWNMIGCPFAFPVDWREVEGHRKVRPPVGYDGTEFIYDQPVLRPWEGYAVYNPIGELTIKFPPIEAEAPKLALTSLLHMAETSGGWAVQLVADGGGSRDTYNFLGWMPDASDTWDRYERAEVPPLPGFVSLYFDHRNWPDVPGLHTTDVRPAGRGRYAWEFFVLAPTGKVCLSWRHTGLPEGLRGHIVDEGTGIWSELKSSGEYTFCSDGSVRAFKLIVEPSGPAPEGYGLSAFPNPFNSSVSIVAQVPELGSELVVYDVKGRRVRTIARSLPPGRYVLSWDGRDDLGRPAASGVYILRLGGVSCKLVLMR